MANYKIKKHTQNTEKLDNLWQKGTILTTGSLEI